MQLANETSPQTHCVAQPAQPAPSTGSFHAYDSQLPIPSLSGYRVVKCLYKVAKTGATKGKAAAPNSYIHIADTVTPENVTENLGALMGHIVSYLQGVEDEIVKGKHKAGTIFVSDAALGLEAVVEKLEEKTVRLNKETVEAWFDTEMLEKLIEKLAEKLELELGLAENGEGDGGESGESGEISEEQLAKLANVADMYKAKYAALAGGKTSYDKGDAEVLQKALVVCGVEKAGIGEKFYMRLEVMKNKKVESLADFGL